MRDWLFRPEYSGFSGHDFFGAAVDLAAAPAMGALLRPAGGGIPLGHVAVPILRSMPASSPIGGPGTSDAFVGAPGNDHLNGTEGDDTFDVSQGGRDEVNGAGGDDFVSFGATFNIQDQVNGGADAYETTFVGDEVELKGDYSAGVTLGSHTLRNVERLTLQGASAGGGNYVVTLHEDNVAAGSFMSIYGLQSTNSTSTYHIDASAEHDGDLVINIFGRGDDVLIAGDGNDYVNGGVSGTDVLDGGGGWNRVSFFRSSAGVVASLALQGSAQDVGGGRLVTLDNFQALQGSTHDDSLEGDSGGNFISTNGGNDIIDGAGGDDDIVLVDNGNGSAYSVFADGGAGQHDTLSFSPLNFGTPADITFSLAAQGGLQLVGRSGSVSATNFENLDGSFDDDNLSGDGGKNTVSGAGGDDRLSGGANDDTLYGDKTIDLIYTDRGSAGASGFGLLDANPGDDVLMGGAGNDLLDGGGGSDTASYADATGRVKVDLGIAGAQGVGGGRGSDTLVSIENLIGGDAGDVLAGNSDANVLTGGAGNDKLSGGNGNDLLHGDSAPELTMDALTFVADGGRAARFSPDDRYVIFHADEADVSGDTNDNFDVFLKDLETGTISRISTGPTGEQLDDGSTTGRFSPDGTKVAFTSSSPDIVTGDTNGSADIFVKELSTGDFTRVSVRSNGGQANGSSTDAEFAGVDTIMFRSSASNLVAHDSNGTTDLFAKNLVTGQVSRISTASNGAQLAGSVSNYSVTPDGNRMAFVLDVNGDDTFYSVYLKDLTSGALTLVSSAFDGTPANASSAGTIAISADGSKVVFRSDADNLVAGDNNGREELFIKDIATGAVTRAVTGLNGEEADGGSAVPVFSADGRFLAFRSDADNLVENDTNGTTDVFVKDLASGATVRITLPNGAELHNDDEAPYAFSSDGRELLLALDTPELPEGLFIANLNLPSSISGNDTLNGGAGTDTLIGGLGADVMDGGADGDVFVYAGAADSTSVGYDTIKNIDFTQDAFDMPVEITGVDAAIVDGALNKASFDADLAAAADGAHLAAGHAVLFTPDSGKLHGKTFLLIDVDGIAGYGSGVDIVVRLATPANLGALGTEDFT